MTALHHSEEISPIAGKLYELFRGADSRHGTYDLTRLRLVGAKMEMKDDNGRGPIDVKGPPTPALWVLHFDGTKPLGVCPLREDGMCRWGVIDIDTYPLDHTALAAHIHRERLPLVLSKSKSGGGHAWLFSSEWLPQAVMNAALVALAARLDYPDAETYPPASGTGNWINMPLWSGTDRCGVKPNGLEMTAHEFLAAADIAAQAPAAIAKLATPERASSKPTSAERQLVEICVEIAATAQGGRAKLIYGRAKDIGRLVGAERIDENMAFDALIDAAMRAGLSYDEAKGHVRNGIAEGKKEPADNRGGNGGRFPDIEKIVILTGGEEKLWRVTVADYGDITLPTKYVWRNDLFNQRCAEELRVGFRRMKENEWADRLNAALEVAATEALPRDETVEGVFFANLEEFCTNRHRGNDLDDLLLRKPFHDEEAGRIYFRFADFISFLRDSRNGLFKGMTMHGIGRMLRAIGHDGIDFGKTTKKLRGKTIEIYWVRSGIFEAPGAASEVPLPPISHSPI